MLTRRLQPGSTTPFITVADLDQAWRRSGLPVCTATPPGMVQKPVAGITLTQWAE
jgi:hypothetical protein